MYYINLCHIINLTKTQRRSPFVVYCTLNRLMPKHDHVIFVKTTNVAWPQSPDVVISCTSNTNPAISSFVFALVTYCLFRKVSLIKLTHPGVGWFSQCRITMKLPSAFAALLRINFFFFCCCPQVNKLMHLDMKSHSLFIEKMLRSCRRSHSNTPSEFVYLNGQTLFMCILFQWPSCQMLLSVELLMSSPQIFTATVCFIFPLVLCVLYISYSKGKKISKQYIY